MQIDVPDDMVYRAEVNATDLHIALAVQLYADNRIDYVDACSLSGLSDGQFKQELLARRLSLQQYPVVRRSAG